VDVGRRAEDRGPRGRMVFLQKVTEETKLTKRVSAEMVNLVAICPEGVTTTGAQWAVEEQRQGGFITGGKD
jgi:hypothetical protein